MPAAPSAARLAAATATVLLALLPGCFGSAPVQGGTPAPSDEEKAPSAWLFAQGDADGRRASTDGAVTLASLPSLGLAWSAATHGAVTGTPTVAGGHVFVGTWQGMVYCLAVRDGSVVWSRDLGSQVDGSVTLAGGLALVGDAAGRLHALNASTGKEAWASTLGTSAHTHLYATPLVVPARGARPAFVVQGVGSDQESARLHGDAPVDFRGQVAALDLQGGALRWRTFLAPEGQTGAPVWGTPVYDAGTDRVVFGTGNAYTQPAGELTDSIVALAAADGKVAWHVQGTAGDVFTQKRPDNPDSDFGATPTLFKAGGRTLAGIGQKSSVFWAVDVASGAVAWKSGSPQSGEGIIGDAALADGAVVVPYASLDRVAALAVADGSVRWQRPLAGPGFADPVAVAGAVLVADGAGSVHGLDAATGNEVWNASVGADGAVFGGLSVAEGMLFVPVVRGGFMGEEGGVVAFAPGGAAAVDDGDEEASSGQVAMRGFRFEPREVHVKAGQSLTWRNEDPDLHTVTAADGSFDATVPAGQSASLRFDAKGTFAYYCKPHASKGADGAWQGMTGTIVVE
jgi:polyvinyl alcohol dehydrogenase (cytochrome)